MCFHASLTSTPQKLETRFQAKFVNDKIESSFKTPKYHLNGFEHPDLAIMTQQVPNKILPAVWGIVPPHYDPENLVNYYREASKFGGGLNAKSEKLKTHYLYKQVYKTQRCLILIDGFFEPHHHQSKSFPYLIKLKQNQAFALAGIYTKFNNGLVTCSILTKNASPFMAEIHNQKKRQPVILNQDLEQKWIEQDLDDNQIFKIINSDYDEELLESYPVDKKLFSPKEDSNIPDILNPFYYQELQTLF